MARLASVVKQGFFPAPPEAIAGILRHLKIPDPPPDSRFKAEDVNILDPCAGEAKALVQLAEGLGVSTGPRLRGRAERQPGRHHRGDPSRRAAARAVQLRGDPHHAALVLDGLPESAVRRRVRRRWPGGGHLPPPGGRPPGARRHPRARSARSTRSSAPGQMCELLDTWFEPLELYLFPDDCRKFNECVVFGRRRKTALPDAQIHTQGVLTSRDIRYARPLPSPSSLASASRSSVDGTTAGPTPSLASPSSTSGSCRSPRGPSGSRRRPSPTRSWSTSWPARPSTRPCVSGSSRRSSDRRSVLNKGHTSLLLLTGMLDGYVPSDPPHVVRGYTGKAEKLHRTERYETPSGDAVQKQVFSESPMPIVRAVWPDGIIRTFSDQVGNDEVAARRPGTRTGGRLIHEDGTREVSHLRLHPGLDRQADRLARDPAADHRGVCRRIGRSVDRVYIDPATSGKKSLFERDGGPGAGDDAPQGRPRRSWPGSTA